MKYSIQKRSSAISCLVLVVASAVSSNISSVFGWNIKSEIHSAYNYGKSGLRFVSNSVRKVYNFFYNRLSDKTKKAFKLAEQAYIDFSNNKDTEKLEKICEYGECFLYYLKNPEKLKISDFDVNENLNKKMSIKYCVNYGSLSVSLNTLLGCLYYYLASFSAKSTYHANYYIEHLKKYFDICNFVSNFIEGNMFDYIIKNIDVANNLTANGKTFLKVRNWANRLPDSSFKQDLKKMLEFYPSLVSVIVLAYNNIKGKFNKNNYETLINNEIKLLLEKNELKLGDETLEYLKNTFNFNYDKSMAKVEDNTGNVGTNFT